MTPLKFTLSDLQQAAVKLLGQDPQPVVAGRLMSEVLGYSQDDPTYQDVRNYALTSKWVLALGQAQLPDGSFGRFHTQDTKVKTAFRTTEEAMDRSLALGLEPSDKVLAQVRQYIVSVLQGQAEITDWTEKNDSFPVLIRHILAGRLAQIDPLNRILDPFWEYIIEIASQAFTSGGYRVEDEVNAYRQLSGIHVPRGYLISQYSLWILSSRKIPPPLEKSVLDWVWHAPHGIGYLGVPLTHPRPDQIGYWLRSMSLLARFPSWRVIACEAGNTLWSQRDENGIWDLPGAKIRSIDYPLSDSWRTKITRKQDLSTSILCMLRKFFD